MRLGFFALCLAIAGLLAQRGLAQTGTDLVARPEPLELSDSGRDYLKSLRFRGIDPTVAYYDPTRPPPPLETSARPNERRSSEPGAGREIDIPSVITSAIIILIAIYLFVAYGGRFGLSLAKAVSNPIRDGDGAEVLPESAFGQTLSRSLRDIVANPDRRAALVALAQHALARVVTKNGLRIQKSWTVRDALHRLPVDQSHMPQLRALVFAAERVHFGGRDVSEEEFNAHLAATRPLLTEAPA